MNREELHKILDFALDNSDNLKNTDIDNVVLIFYSEKSEDGTVLLHGKNANICNMLANAMAKYVEKLEEKTN